MKTENTVWTMKIPTLSFARPAAVVYCAWWAMCPDEYPPVALCVVPLAAALMGYLTMLRRGPRS